MLEFSPNGYWQPFQTTLNLSFVNFGYLSFSCIFIFFYHSCFQIIHVVIVFLPTSVREVHHAQLLVSEQCCNPSNACSGFAICFFFVFLICNVLIIFSILALHLPCFKLGHIVINIYQKVLSLTSLWWHILLRLSKKLTSNKNVILFVMTLHVLLFAPVLLQTYFVQATVKHLIQVIFPKYSHPLLTQLVTSDRCSLEKITLLLLVIEFFL